MKVAVEVGINRANLQEIGRTQGFDFQTITQLVMPEAISAKVQVGLTYLHQESKIIEVPMNLPWP